MASMSDPKRPKRSLSNSENEESSSSKSQYSSWPRFVVVESPDSSTPLKLNPFALSKAVKGVAGDVKSIKKLRSGAVLIECGTKAQSSNLLNVKSLAGVSVSASAHRTLNHSKGIMRDPSRFFAEMTEFDLATELKDQGVVGVKRFTYRKDGNFVPTNTYLLNFAQSSAPKSIKAGYVVLPIETYIPNPLRCFKCQKFGHGMNSCRGKVVCAHCGEHHNSVDCSSNLKKCVNCLGEHSASSKQCPQRQMNVKINQIKYTQNVSFEDAKKLAASVSQVGPSFAQVAASKTTPATRSIDCQTEMTWVRSTDPQPYVTTVTTTQTTSTQSKPL